jgi:hypothetical protein
MVVSKYPRQAASLGNDPYQSSLSRSYSLEEDEDNNNDHDDHDEPALYSKSKQEPA